MSGRSLEDWLVYIEGQHPNNIELGLDRCSQVFAKLNLNRPSQQVITVAGTNGKGSTCAMLTQYLVNDRYTVGTFTSPHFIEFNERIAINGSPVTDDTICQAFDAIDNVRDDIQLTYFEFNTLAAFYIFSQAQLDFWVLEVGLGGRLDSVNMMDTDVAVVTSIALDHTDWLGDSLDIIAQEKTGIARKDKLLISGVQNPPETIEKTAKHIGAILKQKHRDYSFQSDTSSWLWTAEGVTFSSLTLPKLPIENAATVIAVLYYAKLKPTLDKLNRLFQSASLLGRFQQVNDKPKIIIDVAHNPEAAGELLKQLQCLTNKPIAICGMLQDKDIKSVLLTLDPIIDQWSFLDLNVPRGAKAQTLRNFVNRGNTYTSMDDAISSAIDTAYNEDRAIIVFGSFHTVAAYLQHHKKENNLC